MIQIVRRFAALNRNARHGRPMALLSAALLSACATVPQDRGVSDINELLAQRSRHLTINPSTASESSAETARAAEQQVQKLLEQPITPHSAIAVALLRNPQLRLTYARLGLAQAEWQAASSIANPELEFSALETGAAGEMVRLGYSLVQNFTDILFLSKRRQIADETIAQHKAELAAAVQNLAMNVAAAYIEAVSAQQLAQMRQVTAHAAETSAELARRFKQAGNINGLELAQEEAAAEQALLDLETARAEARAARVHLNTLMGLPPFTQWQLATHLPLPVEQEASVQSLIEMSTRQRLDIVAKRHEIRAQEKALGLAKTQRWVPFIGLGIEGERESDGVNFLGPTLQVELPLSSRFSAQALQALAHYEQSRAEGDLLIGQITNQVTAIYARMQAARARVARYRNGLLPQLEAIVQRTQELQNYMIIGQFQLLAAKQREYAGYESYLQALKDYWLARVALTRAVGAELPTETRIGPASESAVVLPTAAPPSMHEGHQGHQGQHGSHGNRAAMEMKTNAATVEPPPNHSSHDNHKNHLDHDSHQGHLNHDNSTDHEQESDHE